MHWGLQIYKITGKYLSCYVYERNQAICKNWIRESD